jgi:glucosamine--fructose-6-phosphate aminotransferase (isomerizing)
MIALKIGYIKGTIEEERYRNLLNELQLIPEKCAWTLKQNEK